MDFHTSLSADRVSTVPHPVSARPGDPVPPADEHGRAEAYWTLFIERPDVERDLWMAVIWQGVCPCTLAARHRCSIARIEFHLRCVAQALDLAHVPSVTFQDSRRAPRRFARTLDQVLRHRHRRCSDCSPCRRRLSH